MIWRAWTVAGPAALLLIAVDAAAQTAGQAQVPTTRETEQPQRDVQAGVRASDAARAARGLPDIEGGAVTFEEVLRDPDNIDLNYRYAQTQIALGEVRGAAATLERILLLEPNLPRVRLLYAVVLFRLDNLEDAEREFTQLRPLEMPAALRAEIDLYVDEIRKRRQRTRIKVLASVGGQYDTNRNAGPGSGQLLFSGVQIPATGTTRARGDFSVNGIGRVDVSHDLGFQDRHKAVGAVTYYDSDQFDQDSLDLRVLSGEAGFAFDLGPLTLTPQANGRYVNLARETYLQSEGLNLTAEYKMTAEFSLTAFGEAEYQRFFAIDVSTDAFSRTGWQYRGGAGAAYKLSPTMQISLDLSYLDKRADQDYYAYRTVEATLGYAWLFPGGQFLLSSIAVAREAYDEPDPAISSNLRTDWRYRGRLTLGQPIAELFGVEAPAWWLRDLTLTATYEVLRSESNITNYTYWNQRAGFGLSKRFDF